jgi:hypothetical protein
MNPTRYEALLASQSAVARRVLSAVPLQEVWPSRRIYQELVRTGGARNVRIVEGCLNTLVDSGLVNEHPRGHFIRVSPKEIPDALLSDELPAETTTPPSVERMLDVSEKDRVEIDAIVAASKKIPELAKFSEVELVEYLQAMSPKERLLIAEQMAKIDPPFHEVTEVVNNEPDPEFVTYLNVRYERIEDMLKLLSEHVDDEMGLALLEIAGDLAETHEAQMDYYHNLGEHSQRKMVLNPGWYLHEVDGESFFSKKAVLDAQDVISYKIAKKKSFDEFAVRYKDVREQNAKEEIEWRNGIFARYEPNGEGERPYYNSLLDKLKNHVPDIEPVADVDKAPEPETIEEIRTERKTRRGMCDLKIYGISQAPEYRAWANIVSPGSVQALLEEGQKVEDSWQSFRKFLGDVGYRPEYGARLVRIDRDGGWNKDNVEWRVGGKAIPARQRAPNGWPLMQNRDKARRELSGIVKEAERRIQHVVG